MLWPKSFRFLTRLNAPPSQSDRDSVERVLGVARASLASIALLAVYFDPPDPIAYRNVAYALIVCWTVYSVELLIWLRYHSSSPRLVIVLHVVDLLFSALITLFTAGPHSPFFVFFGSALIGAGFRWGFPEALTTAVVGIGLLDLEAVVLTAGSSQIQMLEGQFELNRLIIRSSYALIVGFLVGYLAEIAKEQRAQSTVINRVLSMVHADRGWPASLQEVTQEYVRIFATRKAYVLLQNHATGRIFLWQLSPLTEGVRPYHRELVAQAPERFMMSLEPRTFFARKSSSKIQFFALDAGYEQSPRAELPMLPFLTESFESVLACGYRMGEEWSGRLFLVDAQVGRNVERELRFADELLRRLAPSLFSVYLVRRLRSRAGAVERARVARELHDGAIQSIISVEMQVDVLRRAAERDASPMAPDLGHVQQLLQKEVLNLRELMQQMRPVDMGPQQFIEFLAETVDRFRRDTGIAASFASDLQEVELSPHGCREFARILQEALVNIRKHASAHNVLVRFARENGCWQLMVDDDGRGFEFTGKLSLEELDRLRKGPAIIKERVRSMGGELHIDSTPGEGARLEISLPQKGQVAHG